MGDGNHVAYVRIGNESVPADSITLKRLVLHGSNITFDSLVSPYPFRNYSFTRLRSAYLKRTGTELSDSDFISFDLADESGMLTYAELCWLMNRQFDIPGCSVPAGTGWIKLPVSWRRWMIRNTAALWCRTWKRTRSLPDAAIP